MSKVLISSIFIVLISFEGRAQIFTKPNENLLFSFKTERGKLLELAIDSSGQYLAYRYGTEDNIELQFPNELNIESWNRFYFSWYTRGGGIMNSAMDINHLYFTINNYTYTVYSEYYAEEGEQFSYGIRVKDNKTNKSIAHIQALPESIIGSLFPLRENTKIIEGDEIF